MHGRRQTASMLSRQLSTDNIIILQLLALFLPGAFCVCIKIYTNERIVYNDVYSYFAFLTETYKIIQNIVQYILTLSANCGNIKMIIYGSS